MPPSIAEGRSANICSSRGLRERATKKYRTAKAMRPKISSPHSGRIGYWFGSGSVAARTAATALMGTPWLARRCGSAEDEREGETEDGQRLGEGEAEEGDRLEQ